MSYRAANPGRVVTLQHGPFAWPRMTLVLGVVFAQIALVSMGTATWSSPWMTCTPTLLALSDQRLPPARIGYYCELGTASWMHPTSRIEHAVTLRSVREASDVLIRKFGNHEGQRLASEPSNAHTVDRARDAEDAGEPIVFLLGTPETTGLARLPIVLMSAGVALVFFINAKRRTRSVQLAYDVDARTLYTTERGSHFRLALTYIREVRIRSRRRGGYTVSFRDDDGKWTPLPPRNVDRAACERTLRALEDAGCMSHFS